MGPSRLLILSFVAVAIVSVSADGPNESPSVSPAAIARIDARVERALTRRRIPGLSVAIHDGRTLWTKGYGLADVENRVPVNPETIFRLASVSKTITAVAAMRLYESGRLDLDESVRTYVPTFPEKQWTVTSRQLLAHLGGIRHYRGDEATSTKHYPNVKMALSIFRDDPLALEPGTQFLYSTYGYNLLGAVIEGAMGIPYMKAIRSLVLEPAGMSSTRDDDPFAIVPNRAAGYRIDRGGRLQNSAMLDTTGRIPGGGLCATSGDVARFGSSLTSGTLLKPETLEMMWTGQKTSTGKPIGYGLGWATTRYKGIREVSHGGAQAKVSTILYIRPDRKLTVAILSNLESVLLVELARDLADIVDGGPTSQD